MRWSLYAMSLLQVFGVWALLGSAYPDHRESVDVLRVGVPGALLTAALNVVLVRTGLPAYLGRRPYPYGWAAASGAASVGLVVAVLLLGPRPLDQNPVSVPVATVTMTLWLATVSLALPVRHCLAAAGATSVLVAAPLLLRGAPAGFALGVVLGGLLGSAIAGAAARGSAWTAKVVWDLDAAREAQARLAVAEERLRFSRDLHDVLGRNLATIALKSELAVQLARRQRPEAVDQMTEVQRIAQDSQREVREVVRGYRTVELHTELTGAASVLRAANVDCRTELSGADGLPAEAQTVLGWVVREAATNVLRHSEAANCLFRLRVAGGTALLEVENDGVPAVPAPRAEGAGSGLRGLGERLAAHGGTLDTAGSGPGRFRLTAELPITSLEFKK